MIPKCTSCLAKHLSECVVLADQIRKLLSSGVSLSGEVMDGHSAGGVPDHRVDLSGELIQAEKHAVLLDRELALKIRALRRSLQSQRWRPTGPDVERLRTLWYVTYSLDPKEAALIAVEDPQLAAAVSDALKRYASYPTAPDQSSVESCGCAKPSEGQLQRFRNEQFSQPTSVVYCSDSGISAEDKQLIREMVVGIDSMIVLPTAFEKWPLDYLDAHPETFDDVRGNLLVVWPSGTVPLRRTNALAFPSIVDESSEPSEPDAAYVRSRGADPRCFFRIPTYFTVPLLWSVCSSYLEVNGRKEIDDLYSVLRSIDTLPRFGNSNGVVVRSRSDATEKSLFVIP